MVLGVTRKGILAEILREGGKEKQKGRNGCEESWWFPDKTPVTRGSLNQQVESATYILKGPEKLGKTKNRPNKKMPVTT